MSNIDDQRRLERIQYEKDVLQSESNMSEDSNKRLNGLSSILVDPKNNTPLLPPEREVYFHSVKDMYCIHNDFPLYLALDGGFTTDLSMASLFHNVELARNSKFYSDCLQVRKVHELVSYFVEKKDWLYVGTVVVNGGIKIEMRTEIRFMPHSYGVVFVRDNFYTSFVQATNLIFFIDEDSKAHVLTLSGTHALKNIFGETMFLGWIPNYDLSQKVEVYDFLEAVRDAIDLYESYLKMLWYNYMAVFPYLFNKI